MPQAASGVGVVVTPEQLSAAVAEVLSAESARVKETRYRTPPGPLLAAVKAKQPWADVAVVKAELDGQLAALLGPRTAADDAPVEKPKKAPKDKEAAPAPEAAPTAPTTPVPEARDKPRRFYQ